MTLKAIIKTISNDKILSILALFSIILIGTLLYYNLSAKLLNNRIRTLEYFEDNNNDDGCDIIRELLENQRQFEAGESSKEFETYEMKDESGTTYEYLIINKSLNDEQIMNYMKRYIEKYINELNSKFQFDSISECTLLNPENMTFQRIRDIIVNYMGYTNNEGFKATVDEYENDINDSLEEYINSNNNNGQLTLSPENNFNKYSYIIKIYKIILKILFKNQINTIIKTLLGTEKKDGVITNYINNPSSWRQTRIRNYVNYLHRVAITLKFISDENNFKSKITSNLLSNYKERNNGTIERVLSNNAIEPGTNVLELSDYFNNDDDSLLYHYIQDNNNIFIDTITNNGMLNYLNQIYMTSDFGYFHVFEQSYSIIERYTSDEYDACKETIDYENSSM